MPSTAPEPHRTPAPENSAEAAGAHRPWTVAVLGPGGVGGLLAALLSRAGHRVICLAGETTAKTLRENGIRVRSEPFGDFTAEVEAGTVLREPVDLCVVAVKHTSLDEALERVPAAVLGPDALVLPLLNGVEHTGALRDRYGHDRVAAGVIRVESARVAPGVIEHGSPFADIDLAGGTARPLTEVAAVLEAAGLRARVAESETAILWAKLAFLAPFALLTTRYGTGAGPVRTEHREELLALIEETTAVGRAEGAPLDAARSVAMFDACPAGMRSSMQRDAEAGRPLELDAIGGAVLRAAERHGIAVPTATRLVAEVGAL
ncbi:ketopantoate reductase family protein [Streptomyces griseoaurantiacus]|uniref:ketopantoate reductase family protein n=1 Tax=Streptomyces griseoaurantiacus TaxID=68213 RepID=UPI003460241A